jgi:FkbM family methyltransferase
MKSWIKWAARKVGYDLVQYVEVPDRPINVLKLAVDSRIAANQSVRFIQIGANDGVRNDPIRELVVRHKLSGLFVEPLPDLFARLQANYAGHDRLLFEQCAVGDSDGEATLYRVQPSPGLPEWLQGIASFSKEHLSSRKFGVAGLERHVVPVQVPVLSVGSLLKKHGINGCDLLQVDTEGFDCRIVQAALRSGLRPAIINYEYIHTSPVERSNCKRLLAECGYEFLDVGRDTVAILVTAPNTSEGVRE